MCVCVEGVGVGGLSPSELSGSSISVSCRFGGSLFLLYLTEITYRTPHSPFSRSLLVSVSRHISAATHSSHVETTFSSETGRKDWSDEGVT